MKFGLDTEMLGGDLNSSASSHGNIPTFVRSFR